MSHGSGDEENYWPGYVDALTSMVQVLAFVMMMLAMAVFVLSQNVSKSLVETVAKAMKVEAGADASLSQLAKAVLDEAEKVGKAKDAHEAAAADKQAAAKAAEPAASEKQADAKASEAAAADKQADAKAPEAAAAGAAAADKQADAKAPETAASDKQAAAKPAEPAAAAGETAKPESAPTPAGESPKAAQADAGAAQKPEVAALPPAPPRGKLEPAAPAAGKSLVVRFPARGFAASAEAKKDIEGFLAEARPKESGARVVVQAFASSAKSSLSEARHLAFYRAMTLRGELVSRKLDPDKIKILVLDVADEARASSVELIVE